MNFGFTEEQELLRDQVRRFMQEACPMGEVRKLMKSDTGTSPSLWRQVADARMAGSDRSRTVRRHRSQVGGPHRRARRNGPRSVPVANRFANAHCGGAAALRQRRAETEAVARACRRQPRRHARTVRRAELGESRRGEVDAGRWSPQRHQTVRCRRRRCGPVHRCVSQRKRVRARDRRSQRARRKRCRAADDGRDEADGHVDARRRADRRAADAAHEWTILRSCRIAAPSR